MAATECLDVFENGTTPGTRVSQWNCHGGSSQKWTVRSDGTIVGQNSGLCLDVTGGRTANGTELQLWTCNGSTAQKFTWAGR
ncbi:hypothetical protein GCM10020295_18770 [Streptomyces cinereospinus]